MRSILSAVALCTALLLLPSLAAAQRNPEMLSAEAAQEYTHVGRLNIAGRRFCTATLIDEFHVVTAAHCLFDTRTRERMPLSAMHFVAGLHRGAFVAARRIAAVAMPPAYVFDGTVTRQTVENDVAILRLLDPIPASVALPAQPAAGWLGAPLTLVSYSRQRPHAPSLETGAMVLGREGRMLVLDFSVTFGASGAPVFAEVGGRRHLIGIVSASARVSGRQVALTVLTESLLGDLMAALHDPS